MTGTDKDDVRPAVVVPVHRPEPTADEQFSLRRCGLVLAAHSIHLVHPEGLDVTPYKKLLPKASLQPVPDDWMASIRAYNRMMVNPAFYAFFADYTHILVHEPDALVLKDELLFWCQQSFDYIGAPWFDGFSEALPEAAITGVGNSGFCLIRIKAITSLLSSRYRWAKRLWTLRQLLRSLFLRQSNFSGLALLQILGHGGTLSGAHSLINYSWDGFICGHASCADTGFRIAPVSDALGFSWEVNPAVCQRLNNGVSPFGVHAWARYDRPFILSVLYQAASISSTAKSEANKADFIPTRNFLD